MSTTLAFVLAASSLLAPGRDHTEIANAIAARVDAELPLFANDADKRRTAAYLVAIGFRESSLRLDAIGDHGRSFCAFQIHQSSGGTPALLTDAGACVGKAFAMLRTSMQVCPGAPLAWYASGPAGCMNARAQRLSRDRISLASWIVRTVAP
jgi:hypothetical protein